MRSKHQLCATAVTLGTVCALAVAAPAASAHGKGKDKDKDKPSTLRLVAETSQEEFVDTGTPGPSLGDRLVFSETLLERRREVGTSGGVCTVTEAMAPYDVLTFQCNVTLSLRRGQIALQGLIEVQGEDDPGPFLLAVTGGTGKYVGAGGQARFRGREDGGVYRLRLDTGGKKHRRH